MDVKIGLLILGVYAIWSEQPTASLNEPLNIVLMEDHKITGV
jgi:hypothetical protein